MANTLMTPSIKIMVADNSLNSSAATSRSLSSGVPIKSVTSDSKMQEKYNELYANHTTSLYSSSNTHVVPEIALKSEYIVSSPNHCSVPSSSILEHAVAAAAVGSPQIYTSIKIRSKDSNAIQQELCHEPADGVSITEAEEDPNLEDVAITEVCSEGVCSETAEVNVTIEDACHLR